MKKRILSILLTLCMVLALCPVTAFAEGMGSIAITVNGFEVGRTPNDITFTFASTIPGVTFSESDILYVAWQERDPEDPEYWDGVSKTEAFKADTTYRCVIALDNKGLDTIPAITMNGKMPEYCEFGIRNDVPVQFEMITNLGTPSNPPTLDITANGFEVGKTPNDITFTFASTIPGITFSESDILFIAWQERDPEDPEYWDGVSKTEAFKADTTYRCVIALDNKGLDTIPAITMNGKTPEYCEFGIRNDVPVQFELISNLGTPATAMFEVTQNFKYGTRTYDGGDPHTSPYQFVIPAGGSFSLGTIEDCAPYELVGWKESVSGTVYPPSGMVENLSSDLTFDAVYQVQGGLTITVDGFMPGNTPNDCTVTMESTIPGITFSEDDIQYIRWDKYAADGDRYPVTNNDAFQAGTRYKCFIDLDSNGLTEVPVVTVNGNTPDYCTLPYFAGVPEKLSIGCDLGTPVAPTLAVTVDNFEAGKKLSDCTFSFETTNLGVTFSESDILGVTWEHYDPYAEDFYTVDGTNVLQDTDYRVTIELDSKGLTEAPAVTVNGKTAESCEIVTSGGKKVLRITCELGAPLARQLTISGLIEVCKDQDYEFSVTAAEGAEVLYFLYRCGEFGGDTGWDRIEDGVCYGTVPASEYGDADSIELTVYGTAASGKPATATMTVWISPEHIFEDGVCGCGAVQQYTITYDPGEGKGSIADGIKTHGDNFTLSRDTFTRAGYEQTGWATSDGGEKVYDLGGTYTENKDITLYPVWSDIENPKIIGIEDGKTYCSAQTVTVSDNDAIEKVTVNGAEVTLDENNQFTLSPAPGEQKIIATDKSDTPAEVTVTVNDGHTYGEWQSYGNNTHTRYCTVTDCDGYEDGDCAGGEATCVAKAVCDTCKAEYGEIDSANHNLEKIPAKDATVTETGNTEYWHCQDCGKYFADENGTKEIKLEDTIISKLSPEIIEGKGQSITAGEKKELIFKSNAAFSDFIRVELDGKTLDEKNYTVKEGSTVVTLKADYVATLSAGEHTIGIVSESGTATTTFTVNAKAVVDNDTKSPQTGDNSHMALWIALLFMSGAGVIGTMVYGKKKRAK